ncbi:MULTISPECIES: Gfo/Idh/MocA family oxidoreductase [unclassified Fibrobacter]|uniref:Gfo/Idh/MocA family protein n=1 Tax=unclassified Fibrobacter TaxID=2634177 RepID=UPI0025C300D3|nr:MULTISPECIES: Gfo/Idh/MocA family oxidoreductase [unclassified Fibrobacter]
MKPYNAILVGNGTMGKRHRARFEACGVKFIAAADNQEEFDEITDKLTCGTADGLPADFAVIASPASTHYAYAKFFLERKIPVLVEKPLAISGEEAQELVDLAAKNDTLLFVAQSECFNPIFLNFRKHFLAELNARLGAGDKQYDAGDKQLGAGDMFVAGDKLPAGNVRLEFRREHKYSERCRDVDVSLDLLVHDLGLFFTLFRYEDVDISFKTSAESRDRARMYLKVARGPYKGVTADFYVNRDSDVDVRTISVSYGRQGGSPGSDYTVSLARYLDNGEIAHIPDSLENEHRFFLKLLDGACGDWGKRIARIAADCVKIASRQ